MAPGDAVREVKDRLDIVEVIGGYVRLQRAGRDYKGLCPFHSEKTPSFTVSSEKQVWFCFGCNEGGDMLSFVQKAEAVEFPQALQMLAEKAGVELEEHRGGSGRKKAQERQRAKEVNALAAQYFHHILLNHRAGTRGLRYLEKRGIEAETIAAFQVGFAPAGTRSDNLLRFLQKHDVSDGDAVKAGVALGGDGRRAIDRFRGRLMFPIRDEQGGIIGFGGRAMDNQPPKYMNSPQTSIYDKGRVIYGLDSARKTISAGGRALLVEGYFDVLMCHQNGVDYAVASSGTAFTSDQHKAIRRFATELYLCLDTDEAGQSATQRVIADASRSGMRVMVARLENAKDLADFFIRSPEIWDEAVIGRATAGWEWWIKGILDRHKLSSPDGRDTAARAVIPVLSRIPEEATLDIYCQYAAQSLRVDPARLLADVQQYRKTGRVANPQPEPVASINISLPAGREIPGRPEEDRLLGLMLSHRAAGPLLAELTVEEPIGRPELEDLCLRVGNLVAAEGPDVLERNLHLFEEAERGRLVRLSLVSRFTGEETELKVALADCLNRIRLRNYEAAMAALEERLKASGVEEDNGARDGLLNEHRQLARRRAALRVQLFRGPS
ncbi:MAG: DNA primase [Candidatus Dormibacteria bacterium]